MVNSGSFDSADGNRNGKTRCTQAGDAALGSQSSDSDDAACKSGCSKSADSDLPSDESAIEPTPTKTEINSSMPAIASQKNEFPANDGKGTACCSLPLEKTQNATNSNSPDNSEDKAKPTRKRLCLYCDRSFVSANLRQKHVERVHSVKPSRRVSARRQNQLSTTPCVHCDKLNVSEHTLNDLFQHLIQEHPNKYFGCLSCEERFLTSTYLADHNRSQHVTDEATLNLAAPSQIEDIDEVLPSSDNVFPKITRSKLRSKAEEPVDIEENSNLAKRKKKSKLKELRNKKISVKSSKIAIKRSKRLQQQQAKEHEVQKKRRDKKLSSTVKPEAKVIAKQPEKSKAASLNPYPEFDSFYRVKKITDHSIDNLKISSLTFDDVFDKAFFNRIKCNIEENLLHHIDGKLFKNEESESRISNFEKISSVAQEVQNSNADNYGCEISLNAITPASSLSLNSQFGEDFESQIEYGSKPSKKKTQIKSDEGHYKYLTRRKYQASILQQKENRDLSKLDMWTQMLVKERQEKVINKKKNAKEIQEYTSGPEYKSKIKRQELNRVLDRRGPFEDLREEASKKAAFDKLNSSSEGDISQEVFTDVREVLNDLLNKVFEAVKEDDTPLEVSCKEIDQREIPMYLDLRRKTSSTQEEIDKSDRIALICSSQETENFELPTNTVRGKNELAELTGEWARSRMYICAACGGKFSNMKYLLEHKSLYHQNVWVQHHEFVGNQSELYKHLSIPGLGKVGIVEDTVPCKQWKRSDARTCTKCGKQCNALGELHRHVLECGGDWTWMLARKKCKYRPFGAKSRRKRRGFEPKIHNKRKTEPSEKKIYKKPIGGPRQRPSDADTIQRMLANLPAKRSRRSLISLTDVVFKSRKTNSMTSTQTIPATKVKGGKATHNKQQKDTGNSNSNQQRTSRALRSLNKVLSSRILDLNSSLLVKRKIKVMRCKRFTRNTTQSNNNCKEETLKEVTSEEILTQPDSATQQTDRKRKSPKKEPESLEESKPSTGNFTSVKKKSLAKRMLTSRLNLKNFFPVKKKNIRPVKKSSDLDRVSDNAKNDFQNESSTNSDQKSKYLEHFQNIKKNKRGGLKGFVRALSLRKRSSKEEECLAITDAKDSSPKDSQPINSKLEPTKKSSRLQKTKQILSLKKAAKDTTEPVSSSITVSPEVLSKKRKLQQSFRSVINKVKKVKTEKASEKTQVKNTKKEYETPTFLEETSLQKDSAPPEKVVTLAEAKENLQEKEDAVLIVASVTDTTDNSSIPETKFNLDNNEKDNLQAKVELDLDVNESNITDHFSNPPIIRENLDSTAQPNLLDLDSKTTPVAIDTSFKPKCVPLISPNIKGKMRKPSRGLNDCIAMLTNKLQHKDEKMSSSLESLFSTSSTTSIEPRAESRPLLDGIAAPIKSSKPESIPKIPPFTVSKSSAIEETALDLSKKYFSTPNLVFPTDESLSKKLMTSAWTSVDDIIQQVVHNSSYVFNTPKKKLFASRNKVDDTIDCVINNSSDWFEYKHADSKNKPKHYRRSKRRKHSDGDLITNIIFGKDKLIIAPSANPKNDFEDPLIAKIKENEYKMSNLLLGSSHPNVILSKTPFVPHTEQFPPILMAQMVVENIRSLEIESDKNTATGQDIIIPILPVVEISQEEVNKINNQQSVQLEALSQDVEVKSPTDDNSFPANEITASEKTETDNKQESNVQCNPKSIYQDKEDETVEESNPKLNAYTSKPLESECIAQALKPKVPPKKTMNRRRGRAKKVQSQIKPEKTVIETNIDHYINFKEVFDNERDATTLNICTDAKTAISSDKKIELNTENEPTVLENKQIEQTAKLPSDSEDELPLAIIKAKKDEHSVEISDKTVLISDNKNDTVKVKKHIDIEQPINVTPDLLEEPTKNISLTDSLNDTKDIVETLTTDSLKENVDVTANKISTLLTEINPLTEDHIKIPNIIKATKRKKRKKLVFKYKGRVSKKENPSFKLGTPVDLHSSSHFAEQVEPVVKTPVEHDSFTFIKANLRMDELVHEPVADPSNEAGTVDQAKKNPVKLLNSQRTRRKSKSSKKIDTIDNGLFKNFSLVINKKTKRIPPMSIVDDSVCDDILETNIDFLVKPSETDVTYTDLTNDPPLNDSVEEMDMEIEDIPINTSIIERKDLQIATLVSFKEEMPFIAEDNLKKSNGITLEEITTRKSPRKKNGLNPMDSLDSNCSTDSGKVDANRVVSKRGRKPKKNILELENIDDAASKSLTTLQDVNNPKVNAEEQKLNLSEGDLTAISIRDNEKKSRRSSKRNIKASPETDPTTNKELLRSDDDSNANSLKEQEIAPCNTVFYTDQKLTETNCDDFQHKPLEEAILNENNSSLEKTEDKKKGGKLNKNRQSVEEKSEVSQNITIIPQLYNAELADDAGIGENDCLNKQLETITGTRVKGDGSPNKIEGINVSVLENTNEFEVPLKESTPKKKGSKRWKGNKGASKTSAEVNESKPDALTQNTNTNNYLPSVEKKTAVENVCSEPRSRKSNNAFTKDESSENINSSSQDSSVSSQYSEDFISEASVDEPVEKRITRKRISRRNWEKKPIFNIKHSSLESVEDKEIQSYDLPNVEDSNTRNPQTQTIDNEDIPILNSSEKQLEEDSLSKKGSRRAKHTNKRLNRKACAQDNANQALSKEPQSEDTISNGIVTDENPKLADNHVLTGASKAVTVPNTNNLANLNGGGVDSCEFTDSFEQIFAQSNKLTPDASTSEIKNDFGSNTFEQPLPKFSRRKKIPRGVKNSSEDTKSSVKPEIETIKTDFKNFNNEWTDSLQIVRNDILDIFGSDTSTSEVENTVVGPSTFEKPLVIRPRKKKGFSARSNVENNKIDDNNSKTDSIIETFVNEQSSENMNVLDAVNSTSNHLSRIKKLMGDSGSKRKELIIEDTNNISQIINNEVCTKMQKYFSDELPTENRPKSKEEESDILSSLASDNDNECKKIDADIIQDPVVCFRNNQLTPKGLIEDNTLLIDDKRSQKTRFKRNKNIIFENGTSDIEIASETNIVPKMLGKKVRSKRKAKVIEKVASLVNISENNSQGSKAITDILNNENIEDFMMASDSDSLSRNKSGIPNSVDLTNPILNKADENTIELKELMDDKLESTVTFVIQQSTTSDDLNVLESHSSADTNADEITPKSRRLRKIINYNEDNLEKNALKVNKTDIKCTTDDSLVVKKNNRSKKNVENIEECLEKGSRTSNNEPMLLKVNTEATFDIEIKPANKECGVTKSAIKSKLDKISGSRQRKKTQKKIKNDENIDEFAEDINSSISEEETHFTNDSDNAYSWDTVLESMVYKVTEFSEIPKLVVDIRHTDQIDHIVKTNLENSSTSDVVKSANTSNPNKPVLKMETDKKNNQNIHENNGNKLISEEIKLNIALPDSCSDKMYSNNKTDWDNDSNIMDIDPISELDVFDFEESFPQINMGNRKTKKSSGLKGTNSFLINNKDLKANAYSAKKSNKQTLFGKNRRSRNQIECSKDILEDLPIVQTTADLITNSNDFLNTITDFDEETKKKNTSLVEALVPVEDETNTLLEEVDNADSINTKARYNKRSKKSSNYNEEIVQNTADSISNKGLSLEEDKINLTVDSEEAALDINTTADAQPPKRQAKFKKNKKKQLISEVEIQSTSPNLFEANSTEDILVFKECTSKEENFVKQLVCTHEIILKVDECSKTAVEDPVETLPKLNENAKSINEPQTTNKFKHLKKVSKEANEADFLPGTSLKQITTKSDSTKIYLRVKKHKKNNMDIDIANILDSEIDSKNRRSPRKKLLLNEKISDLSLENSVNEYSLQEESPIQPLKTNFVESLTLLNDNIAMLDEIAETENKNDETYKLYPDAPENHSSDSNESLPLLERINIFQNKLAVKDNNPNNLTENNLPLLDVVNSTKDYLLISASSTDDLFKTTDSIAEKLIPSNLDSLLPVSQTDSMEDVILENKGLPTKNKKRKTKKKKFMQKTAENEILIEPKTTNDSSHEQPERQYQLAKINIKDLLLSSLAPPNSTYMESEQIPSESSLITIDSSDNKNITNTFSEHSNALVAIEEVVKSTKTKAKKQKGKKSKHLSPTLDDFEIFDGIIQENTNSKQKNNKSILSKNLGFTALKNVLSTFTKTNRKNTFKKSENMFSDIQPLSDIISCSEMDIAPVLDEIDKSLESEDIYDFNTDFYGETINIERSKSVKNMSKKRSKSCPKADVNKFQLTETHVDKGSSKKKSKRSAKVEALESIHEKVLTDSQDLEVNLASNAQLKTSRTRYKSLTTTQEVDEININEKDSEVCFEKSNIDKGSLLAFEEEVANILNTPDQYESNLVNELDVINSSITNLSKGRQKTNQNINTQDLNQSVDSSVVALAPEKSDHNQIDSDGLELRRSRRGSRKVASYNENDLIDPLIDALESRRIRSSRKDKSAEKLQIQNDALKDAANDKPKLSSEELFDLLKTSSYEHENLVVSKPCNSFFDNLNEHSVNDTYQDLPDGDCGNMLENPSEIAKDADQIYEFTEESPENTTEIKELFGKHKKKNKQISVLSDAKTTSEQSNCLESIASLGLPESKEKDTNYDQEKFNYCDICKRSFIRVENLIKHKTTITHISKLSELEAKEDEERARLEKQTIEDQSNSSVKAIEALRDAINITDILQQSERSQVSIQEDSPSLNNRSLKLVDIISDVLNKPVMENYNPDKQDFSASNIQNNAKSDIRRYKSLGERKSFDSENHLSQINSPLPTSYLQPTLSQTTILEKQINLLENIIGNNLENIAASKHETENSFIDDISSCSIASIVSGLDNNSCTSNRSVYHMNSENIEANSDVDFIKPTQYEEISEDSASARVNEDQKLRKTLNRDEELFLECCSLLKSGSEVSNSTYSKKTKKPGGSLKELDDAELLDGKKLIQTAEEAHEYCDNSRTPTPLGDTYDDEASNSNTISSNWHLNSEKPLDKNRSFSFEEVKNKEAAGMTFGEILTKGLRNQFEYIATTNERSRDRIQEVLPGRTLSTDDRIDDSDCSTASRKVATKGARKVYEGLKVSIPTEDLNLDVLNTSPSNKKCELKTTPTSEEALEESRTKPRPTRKSKPVKKSQVGSNLLFKVNKKKSSTHITNLASTEKQDIYNFEETQDNTDVFIKPSFKDVKSADMKKDIIAISSDNESLGYADSIGADAKSVSSVSSISAMSSKKPETTPENITKKKYRIMGKIFRNAAKSKVDEIDEELRSIPEIPEIDNLELVENYVRSCQRVQSAFLPPPPPPPIDGVPKKPKMSEEEMNMLFDQLIGKEITDSKSEKLLNKSTAVKIKTGDAKKKNGKVKNRKRARGNSESSDDEFNITRTSKKRTNKKNNQDDSGINLELELKECIGVASRKSQRTCTSGKQNILVEYWSSDEEAFEAMLESHKVLPKKDEKKKSEKNKAEINESIKTSSSEVSEIPIIDKPSKPKITKKKMQPLKKIKKMASTKESEVTAAAAVAASNRRKRAAANPLYHWSSSSEDESHSLIEIKPVREEDDEDDRPIQHGWIVGDSPKKLVTMLALTKGKKTDIDSVKEQGKRRTSNTAS